MLTLGLGLAVLVPHAARAAAPPAAESAPDAATRDKVRTLVRGAGELMDRGDAAGAVQKLEEARQLRPDPSIDYNLGIAYDDLKRGPEAAAALERFLAGADPAKVLPERLDDARARLKKQKESLARLGVRVMLPDPNGTANLFLDDKLVAPLPGGVLSPPRFVLPGPHTARITEKDSRDFLVSLELRPGELRELSGELRSINAPDGLLAEAPRGAESKPLYKKWWFWTAVGGGAVALLAVAAAGGAGAFTHTAPGSDLDPVEVKR